MKEEEQLRKLYEEIASTQYNKATEHHIGLLKAKIAKLERVVEAKRKRKGGYGYAVKKEGDATVMLVGFPSTGKSTLLSRLTKRVSKVAPYAFTTTTVIPGTMEIDGFHIQLLDLPGLVEGAARGSGRGAEVLSVIRVADLLLLVIDATQPWQKEKLVKELWNAGIRINRTPPDVTIKKQYRGKGGVTIHTTRPLSQLSEKTIRDVAAQYGIHTGDITIREDISLDDFIDVLEGNRVYVPALTVFTKCDVSDPPEEGLRVSGLTGEGIPELERAIVDALGLIHIYTKPRVGEVDFSKPLVLKRGATVKTVCEKLHRDFLTFFKHAYVKGRSAKYDWEKVGLDHVLEDGDIVSIVTK